MGKGSTPRPFEVDHETFASNWNQIFGKKSNERNQSGTSNQVHSGERSAVCTSEGQQGVRGELPADGKKPSDE